MMSKFHLFVLLYIVYDIVAKWSLIDTDSFCLQHEEIPIAGRILESNKNVICGHHF